MGKKQKRIEQLENILRDIYYEADEWRRSEPLMADHYIAAMATIMKIVGKVWKEE